MSNLIAPEFANIANKINNNSVPVVFFRGNLFNATVRDAKILKNTKIFYEEKNNIYTTTLSINQRHKDLFLYLLYAEKSDIQPDGSFISYISLYEIAKLMGYKHPKKDGKKIKKLLKDLQMTVIEVRDKITGERGFAFNLINGFWYDGDKYAIKISEDVAKYLIYSTTVYIPKELVYKLISIQEARIKALITYIFSNRPAKYGTGFYTICEKLDITDKYKKSRFKKVIKENAELLSEFGILYQDEKFFLQKEKIGIKFYHALSDKELKTHQQKQIEKVKPQIINAKVEVLITNALGRQEQVSCIICDVKPVDENLTSWQPIAQEVNNPSITYPLRTGTKEELEKKYRT